jgi:hypothetical protein
MNQSAIANRLPYATCAASVSGKLSHIPFKDSQRPENVKTFASWGAALAFLEGVQFTFEQLGLKAKVTYHEPERHNDAHAALYVRDSRGEIVASYNAHCFRSLILKELVEEDWEGCI